MSSKLFAFNRTLPEPYNGLSSKKSNVVSKYSDKTQATLAAGPIKAIHAYLNMRGGSDGAIGSMNSKCVAEYPSKTPDNMHLVVYDPDTGNHTACVYNTETETVEQYVAGDKARDSAALFLSMMPVFLEDEEFNETLSAYAGEYSTGLTNVSEAAPLIGLLCDNIYRRVIDDECPAHVKTKVDNSGNITRIHSALLLRRSHGYAVSAFLCGAKGQIDAGRFIPDTVYAGEFKIFASMGGTTPILKSAAEIAHENFVGKYSLGSARVLSPAEQCLVPTLEPWYVLPGEAVNICKHAQATSENSQAMRNFMLRGPAGTGKTMAAKAIAAGLGLPYMKYTCSANSEVYDFIGQVFPNSATPSTGDENLDKQREELMSMGGINYENVSQYMKLPGVDDMEYDPEDSYKQLTGLEKSDVTYQQCVTALMNLVTDKILKLSAVQTDTSSEQTYTYVETDFIKALKHGYVIEVQEPSTISQPGVLVGLNSLLEQGGSITLPTGEIVNRHPDTVVIITTNVSYEGCRNINQSVTDRMDLIYEVPLPTPEIMAQRAMKITGFDDEIMIAQMVGVVNKLDEYCRNHAISDDSVGMRGLIDWITSVQVTEDPYESAKYTVISKAATDYEDQLAILTTVVEPQFAPRIKVGVR